MKIAIASSGLGHVSRGIETWALDTAVALHARGIDVTLFAGGWLSEKAAPLKASPCPQSPVSSLQSLPICVLPCWRRYDRRTRLLRLLMPGFTWRWGLKDGYGIEQFTFWRALRRELMTGDFDILHVQDPMLAYWCARARRKGRLKTKEILAHGTEESPEFLSQFDYVQHLAPWHLEQVTRRRGAGEKTIDD